MRMCCSMYSTECVYDLQVHSYLRLYLCVKSQTKSDIQEYVAVGMILALHLSSSPPKYLILSGLTCAALWWLL